jgi:hypothetical protein
VASKVKVLEMTPVGAIIGTRSVVWGSMKKKILNLGTGFMLLHPVMVVVEVCNKVGCEEEET